MSYTLFGSISLLPVMEASDVKDDFTPIIIGVVCLLFTIHVSFSELCYYAYGDNLTEPLIVQQIPANEIPVIMAKILYMIMILFSYPLTIFTANQVIEGFIFGKMMYSELRKWLKNLSRTVVVALGVSISIVTYYSLPVINGFFGALFGTIVVILVPSLMHNKILAETKCDRCCNYFLMGFAITSATIIPIAVIVIFVTGF
jgi:hypothetical protein